MTRSQVDQQIHEMRAIEIIERVTDAVEKYAKAQKKIGQRVLSIEKKERAVKLSQALLGMLKINVPELFLEIVIESTCLYHDNILPLDAVESSDPTIDEEDDDD